MYETLKSLLNYDKSTGVFTWKVGVGRCKRGDQAGSAHGKGYIRIQVLGNNILAHRLAWMFVYGDFPSDQIDHINGIKSDNRILNLRNVTATTNSQNMHFARVTSKSGLLGVESHRGKWRARIRVNGKKVLLGTMNTPQEAHAAYVEAKRRLHPGCSI